MSNKLSQAAKAIMCAVDALFDYSCPSDKEIIAAALREAINQCQNGQGFIPAPQLLLIAEILEKNND